MPTTNVRIQNDHHHQAYCRRTAVVPVANVVDNITVVVVVVVTVVAVVVVAVAAALTLRKTGCRITNCLRTVMKYLLHGALLD